MISRQPYWFDQALNSEEHVECSPLTEQVNTDVCIVGGGFTGLWTAIKIKQKSPETNVVVLEKKICGAGASGRNGGCMLTFATKFASLIKFFGEKEAIRLVLASEQAVFDIDDFCKQHNIDAEIRIDGAVYTATNPTQEKLLTEPLSLLNKFNINRWVKLKKQDAKRLSGSNKTLDGISTDAAGSLQPAKLVLGLKKHALTLGVQIYEHTAYKHMVKGKVVELHTEQGSVLADKVVFAVNAWMGELFKSFNKHYVLVSSDMLITKPMPNALEQQGLNHGKAIADSRIFVHYYRTTPDGRLMLGKGGNLFAYKNQLLPAFDKESGYKEMLQSAFQQLFPNLGCDFERSWTGASDRSTTGLPFFGSLPNTDNIFYGLGYSGNGVVQSYLGGEFLSSMVLGLKNEWTESKMAKGPLGSFPPEPIRYIGAQLVKNAILRKEQREDKGKQAFWFDNQLAKFAAAAGKADK